MKQNLRVGEGYAPSRNNLKQRYIRYISLLAVLTTMCLYAVKQVSAQEAEPAATAVADTTTSVRDTLAIEEVQVNTGYQRIAKERATGSFVYIDNELLNRRVTTNIIERLDGVAGSLIFNKDGHLMGNRSEITIRGRSTINGNLSPLIVLDNFPYEGDINNINPNDIENITILKDASAASIWGTRAGNGVIVITTKKGSFNQRMQGAFNSNLTIGNSPNLFYVPQLSSKDYIDIEKYLFEKGRYGAALNTDFAEISPVAEALQRRGEGLLNEGQMNELIGALASRDVRNDLKQYMYRNSVNQQHQINFRGGNEVYKYFLSAGLDNNIGNIRGTHYERITLSSKNTYDVIADKLTLHTGVDLSNAVYKSNNRAYLLPLYPYEQLIDDTGNHLAVSDGTLRLSYVEHMEALGLLDWHYRPLSETDQNQTRKINDYRFNSSLNYTPLKGLDLSIHYMYQKMYGHNSIYDHPTSYYVRNLVNQFTQIDENGTLYRPLAVGGIANNSESQTSINNGRFQIAYNRHVGNDHEVNMLGGYEFRDSRSNAASVALYGFDEDLLTNVNSSLNFLEPYPIIYGNRSSRIPLGISNNGSRDINVSYYFAGTYRYKSRYTISSSFRRDESNLFGVDANQRGVPLWSLGVLWSLSHENFFNINWLSLLKLRATYGYNGNIDKSTTAYLTAVNSGSINTFGSPMARISNPPNPSLRWERVRNINIGIDFGFKDNILSGSIEYYTKDGIDLIGDSPIAPQTGQSTFRGNSARLYTKGMDIALNSNNLSGVFSWQTNFLFNFVRDRITEYHTKAGSNYEIVNANYQNPLVGYPYFSVFAFPLVGLNENGRIIGMLDDAPSTDYTGIRNSSDTENINYVGPGSPIIFGSLRNTFMLKNVSLSFNIQYKGGYFYRSPYYLNNTALFNGSYRNQIGYNDRWKAPGDEMHTKIPSLVYPAVAGHDILYGLSDIHTQKADHIRLQDVRLGYILQSRTRHITTPTINIFLYASNLGVLWKSSELWLDPDAIVGTPAPRQYSLGMNITF